MKSWFENPDWSDVTIVLSDGRKIPAHKSVLCTRNGYFNALCGVNSRFAEGEQKEIKLEEDDPDLLREVIRSIYGWPVEYHTKRTWQQWLALAKTADKYLAPDLVSSAGGAMLSYGFGRTMSENPHEENPRDLNGACDILEGLQEIDSNPDVFKYSVRLASRLKRQVHASERFRSYLLGNPKVMLGLIKEDSIQPDAVHAGINSCDHHWNAYVYNAEQYGPCLWCEDDEEPVNRYNTWHVKCV